MLLDPDPAIWNPSREKELDPWSLINPHSKRKRERGRETKREEKRERRGGKFCESGAAKSSAAAAAVT